jgi:hypothetical protein
VGLFRNSSPNFLVDHSRLNQYCVLIWASFADFHSTEVLELRHALKLSSDAQTCENARSQTC